MPVFRLFLMSGDQYLSNVSHVNLKSKDRFYCHAAWIAEKLVDWYAMKVPGIDDEIGVLDLICVL